MKLGAPIGTSARWEAASPRRVPARRPAELLACARSRRIRLRAPSRTAHDIASTRRPPALRRPSSPAWNAWTRGCMIEMRLDDVRRQACPRARGRVIFDDVDRGPPRRTSEPGVTSITSPWRSWRHCSWGFWRKWTFRASTSSYSDIAACRTASADQSFWVRLLLFLVTCFVPADARHAAFKGCLHHRHAAIRQSVFTAISAQTGTGFSRRPTTRWPGAIPVGSCCSRPSISGSAGSTSGGMSVIRWLLIWKQGQRGSAAPDSSQRRDSSPHRQQAGRLGASSNRCGASSPLT